MYKYMKIKGLDSSTRELNYTIAREQKSNEHGMSFRSSLKTEMFNESLQHLTS